MAPFFPGVTLCDVTNGLFKQLALMPTLLVRTKETLPEHQRPRSPVFLGTVFLKLKFLFKALSYDHPVSPAHRNLQ